MLPVLVIAAGTLAFVIWDFHRYIKIKRGAAPVRLAGPSGAHTMNAPKDKSIKGYIISQDSVLEIKNALQIILGEAQLTVREEKLTEQGQKNMKVICRTVFRIDKLLPSI